MDNMRLSNTLRPKFAGTVKRLGYDLFEYSDELWRNYTAGFRELPDVLIIGAMKGGTTSLYNYLIQHPEIGSGKNKEIRFFDDNYHKGLDWYRSQFPLKSKKVTLEATPRYMFQNDALRRIKRALPRGKFIAVLREPVERAYSHYQHMVRRGREHRTFEEGVQVDMEYIKDGVFFGEKEPRSSYFSYLRRSLYAIQLKRFIKEFGKEQVLVMNSHHMFEDPQGAVDTVCDFLNLDHFVLEDLSARNTGGGYRKNIPIESELRDFFEPYNQELFDLIGVSPWWNYCSQ